MTSRTLGAIATLFSLILFGTGNQTYGQDAGKKPVKVYILSGQSNMVGLGQVGVETNRKNPTFQTNTGKDDAEGAILSIYPGPHTPDRNYDKEKPLETHVVPIGYLPRRALPEIKPGQIGVARGFLRIPETRDYSFNTAPNSIFILNGKVLAKNIEDTVETAVANVGEGAYPFKIIYLKASGTRLWTTVWGMPGTLATEVEKGRFPYLVDENKNWVIRDDVWYQGVITATANKWLAPGCGATPDKIGPELGFGHMVGNFHEEPVLIIKAAQGNRSLGWDFLPPGSERLEYEGHFYAGYRDPQPSWPTDEEPKKIDWYAGKQYDDAVAATKMTLANFDQNFPQWAGRGYEIAGFAWLQGHKDTGHVLHANRYETNLVRLIEALRKDFNAPNAKFVVATGCGNPGLAGNDLYIAEAQLAVDGDKGKYPAFKNNVKSVDVRKFFPKVEDSPKNQGYHYHQNAGTYMEIGEAMGKAMVELERRK